MKNLILVFTILCFTLLTNIGFAQELLVLSGENSQNSKRWQEEVLPEYSASAPGKNLPVKIVPVKGNRFPEWLAKALDEGTGRRDFGYPYFSDLGLNKRKGDWPYRRLYSEAQVFFTT